ncbi:MAG: histidinol dehydrogenase, partial [Fibrobacter sp.]|nr:histidinol dehydrogenase [Fibrobacter sp.]
GGAQAIAAMAYGTESIPKADVIVGPGNKFVAAAKKMVYGDSGIDMIAGPTEVMVIADESCNPEWTAADLLAQAEHDIDAQAVLVVFSSKSKQNAQAVAESVRAEVLNQLQQLPKDSAAFTSLERNGLIIVASSAEEAAMIANRKAPEHLELAVEPTLQPRLAELVHNYGSLFIGHEAAEVLGDYAAGLNHTLPTAGSARFTGGLSVRHFLKTVTTLRTEGDLAQSKSGVQESAKAAATIGMAEGLVAHSRAAQKRVK